IILLKCWSKDPSNRPDFSRLLETFRGIPKKSKLFRSPSHPNDLAKSIKILKKNIIWACVFNNLIFFRIKQELPYLDELI
ncbi:kinase suppressor of Ras 2 isoform X2, partial [Brachionus plicatilis]